MKMTVKKDTQIGSRNTFVCGWWTEDEQNKLGNYDRRLEIGENVHITSCHHFDIAGAFIVGKGSWIAGLGSQFWTHGAGVRERNILIGEQCYIGSAVRFAPGSYIGNRNIVSLGSVVTEEFNVENALIGGMPARILSNSYDWEGRRNVFRQTGEPGTKY